MGKDITHSPRGQKYPLLFTVSFLSLFVELLLIRWVGIEVRIFAFFRNMILISCLRGIGIGFGLQRFGVGMLGSIILIELMAGAAARANEPAVLYEEKGSAYLIEAERYSSLKDGTWVVGSEENNFSGEGYLQDPRNLKPENKKWDQTAGAEYALELKGGEYFLWVRALAPRKWGRLGRSESNSAWVGIDRENFRQLTFKHYGEWRWTMIAGPVALAPGRHVLNLRIREGGFAIDRIILTADPDFHP